VPSVSHPGAFGVKTLGMSVSALFIDIVIKPWLMLHNLISLQTIYFLFSKLCANNLFALFSVFAKTFFKNFPFKKNNGLTLIFSGQQSHREIFSNQNAK
jgi:hypothetical protein